MLFAFFSRFFSLNRVRSGIKRPFPLLLAKVKSQNCLTVKWDDVTSNRTEGIRRVVEDGSVIEWVEPNPVCLQ